MGYCFGMDTNSFLPPTHASAALLRGVPVDRCGRRTMTRQDVQLQAEAKFTLGPAQQWGWHWWPRWNLSLRKYGQRTVYIVQSTLYK